LIYCQKDILLILIA